MRVVPLLIAPKAMTVLMPPAQIRTAQPPHRGLGQPPSTRALFPASDPATSQGPALTPPRQKEKKRRHRRCRIFRLSPDRRVSPIESYSLLAVSNDTLSYTSRSAN